MLVHAVGVDEVFIELDWSSTSISTNPRRVAVPESVTVTL
jgi:hypothetical protein